MFTEKELTAYRNIKAPDELRQKIIGNQKSNKRIISVIATVAACFVLIISGVAINNNQSNIIINGQKLNSRIEYNLASSMAKSVSSTVTVPLRLKVKESTTVSVTDGLICIDGNTSKEATITSSTEVLWEVEPTTENSEFIMLITDKKGVQKVTLKYNNEKITITKEKTK